MKATVAKLVSYILEHIADKHDKAPSEKAMRSLLARKGYKRRDIDVAFEVINNQLMDKPVLSDAMPPLRQLAFYENNKIQQDVHHAMTRLEMMGLIEPIEREMLLERFLHTDGPADMEALDFALSYIICTGHNVEVQQTMLTVFEGFSPTIH